MFSSLQDALKKLREAKEADRQGDNSAAAIQPAKRQAVEATDDLMDFELDDIGVDDDELNALLEEEQVNKPVRNPPAQSSVARLAKFRCQPRTQTQALPVPPPTQPTATNVLVEQAQEQTITTTTTIDNVQRPKRQQDLPGPAGMVCQRTTTNTPITNSAATTTVPKFNTPFSRSSVRANKEADAAVATDADFEESSTWNTMLSHLNLPTYKPSTASQVIRTRECAGWPISRIQELTQTQKIDWALVLIREIVNNDSDASAVLIDPTGDIRGSIHHVAMKRLAHSLGPGTALILKHVVAMKLAGWPPYLVITEEMIAQIFTTRAAGTRQNPIILTPTQYATQNRQQDVVEGVDDFGILLQDIE